MAPDPESILKDITPVKGDWTHIVGSAGVLNALWWSDFLKKYLPEDWKAKDEYVQGAGAAASWVLMKLVPKYLKGGIGEAIKFFFAGTFWGNLGLVERHFVPQVELKAPAAMPESYGYPESPAAPPAPQTIEEFAALEAQTRPARYYGR